MLSFHQLKESIYILLATEIKGRVIVRCRQSINNYVSKKSTQG